MLVLQHQQWACPIRIARSGEVHINRLEHISTLLISGLVLSSWVSNGYSHDLTTMWRHMGSRVLFWIPHCILLLSTSALHTLPFPFLPLHCEIYHSPLHTSSLYLHCELYRSPLYTRSAYFTILSPYLQYELYHPCLYTCTVSCTSPVSTLALWTVQSPFPQYTMKTQWLTHPLWLLHVKILGSPTPSDCLVLNAGFI